MRYNIFIDGEFTNVKSVFIDQTMQLNIKCRMCGQLHPKSIVVSSESLAYVDKREKTNLAINCTGCKYTMGVMIKPPKVEEKIILQNKEPIVVYLNTKRFHSFLVSFLEMKKCSLVGEIFLDSSVLSDQDWLFSDINPEDGSWIGVDNNGNNTEIKDFEVRYEGIK